MKKLIIAVFGSGKIKADSSEWQIAQTCGCLLAEAGFTVMNGGYKGVMEASAQGAKAAKGETIGVTTDEFPDAVKNPFIDVEKRMKRWHERLEYLVENASGYLVLDGGTGTLVECITLLEMTHKNFLKKPVVVLGQKMQSLLEFLKTFPEVKIKPSIKVVRTPQEAISCLKQNLA